MGDFIKVLPTNIRFAPEFPKMRQNLLFQKNSDFELSVLLPDRSSNAPIRRDQLSFYVISKVAVGFGRLYFQEV